MIVPRHFHVRVLPEDFLKGVARKSNLCPIAEAIIRTIKKTTGYDVKVKVDRRIAIIDYPTGDRHIYQLAGKAAAIVIAVDENQPLPKRATFNLDARDCTVGRTPVKNPKKASTSTAKHTRKRSFTRPSTTRIGGYLAPQFV